jgi:hypothetical protein
LPGDLTKANSDRCAGAYLHIGYSRRHAEFPAAHFGEDRDAFADLLVRGAREAEPQLAAGINLVGRPFRSRIDGDAGGERGLVKL